LNNSYLLLDCVQVVHLFITHMQPHPPQLPTDAPASPAPKNLKKGVLLLLGVVAIIAALIAFLLPEKQVEATKSATSTQPAASRATQQVQSDAYKDPTH
jgi:hypothetical protein